jgi:hypothetical protein
MKRRDRLIQRVEQPVAFGRDARDHDSAIYSVATASSKTAGLDAIQSPAGERSATALNGTPDVPPSRRICSTWYCSAVMPAGLSNIDSSWMSSPETCCRSS